MMTITEKIALTSTIIMPIAGADKNGESSIGQLLPLKPHNGTAGGALSPCIFHIRASSTSIVKGSSCSWVMSYKSTFNQTSFVPFSPSLMKSMAPNVVKIPLMSTPRTRNVGTRSPSSPMLTLPDSPAVSLSKSSPVRHRQPVNETFFNSATMFRPL